MEVKQINQLMVAMGRHGIKRLVVKQADCEVTLEREEGGPSRLADAPSVEEGENNPLRGDFARRRVHSLALPDSSETNEVPAVSEPVGKDALFIDSPMVGTVYLSPSPKDSSFVQVGDRIEENTVVCLVEAMKVMNEVRAGVRGVVAEILVENASPVEYATRLFRIIP